MYTLSFMYKIMPVIDDSDSDRPASDDSGVESSFDDNGEWLIWCWMCVLLISLPLEEDSESIMTGGGGTLQNAISSLNLH